MTNKRKRKSQVQNGVGASSAKSDLPEGVHHYQTLDEVPWDIQK
jgi:hypothetical protein